MTLLAPKLKTNQKLVISWICKNKRIQRGQSFFITQTKWKQMMDVYLHSLFAVAIRRLNFPRNLIRLHHLSHNKRPITFSFQNETIPSLFSFSICIRCRFQNKKEKTTRNWKRNKQTIFLFSGACVLFEDFKIKNKTKINGMKMRNASERRSSPQPSRVRSSTETENVGPHRFLFLSLFASPLALLYGFSSEPRERERNLHKN